MRNMQNLRVYKDINRLGYSVVVFSHDNKSVMKHGEFTPLDDNAISYEAPLVMSEQAAQVLMDDLWDAGIRPTECKHTSETIQAMKAHIEDLRYVALYGTKTAMPPLETPRK